MRFRLDYHILIRCLFGIVFCLQTAIAMTPLSGSDDEDGYKLPFRIRGDLETDFGFETGSGADDVSFLQNTELRLHTKKEILHNLIAELQLFITYSNTDNQFTTSIKKGSLLDKTIDSLINFNDDTTGDASNWQDLLDFGEIALNSRFIPKLSLILDRASIAWHSKFLHVTLGKQVVAWGSGYAWNPTDAINLRNPLEPTEPKNGVGALVIEIPAKEWFLFTLAMAPGKKFEESTEGIRFKFMTKPFDFAFSANLVGGSERIMLDNIYENESLTYKPMLGFDFNTILFENLNVWLESSLSTVGSQNISQAVTGVQWVMFKNLRCIFEYYFNSIGLSYPYTNDEKTGRNLGLASLGDIGGIGRRYVAGGLLYIPTPQWDFRLLGTGNISDKSAGLIPIIKFKPIQSFAFELKTAIFFSRHNQTEFGSFKNTYSTLLRYIF